jgi:hypothetical protein
MELHFTKLVTASSLTREPLAALTSHQSGGFACTTSENQALAPARCPGREPIGDETMTRRRLLAGAAAEPE